VLGGGGGSWLAKREVVRGTALETAVLESRLGCCEAKVKSKEWNMITVSEPTAPADM
jgi:hypothetical protein